MSCTVINMRNYRVDLQLPDDELTTYCKTLRLSEVQILACRDVARITKSIDEGKLTADRIHDKMRANRTQFGTRGDDGPKAA